MASRGLCRGSVGRGLGCGSGGDAFVRDRGDQPIWPQHDDPLPEACPLGITFSKSLRTRPTPKSKCKRTSSRNSKFHFTLIMVSYIIKILVILIILHNF